jgi:hypothetical protein
MNNVTLQPVPGSPPHFFARRASASVLPASPSAGIFAPPGTARRARIVLALAAGFGAAAILGLILGITGAVDFRSGLATVEATAATVALGVWGGLFTEARTRPDQAVPAQARGIGAGDGIR